MKNRPESFFLFVTLQRGYFGRRFTIFRSMFHLGNDNRYLFPYKIARFLQL